MAENIMKVYPGGQWYKDSPQERYDHVKEILDLRKNNKIDDADVRWFLKTAIVNKIYVSEEVYQIWKKSWPNTKSQRQKDMWDKLKQDGCLDGSYMDLRKFTKGRRFEHIVPSSVYLKRLLDLNNSGQLDYPRFENIRSKVNICVITNDQNKRLDKKFQSKMPGNVDFESGNEFARYDDKEVNIKIHGRPRTSHRESITQQENADSLETR